MIRKIHQLAKTEDLKDFEVESQNLLKKHNPDHEYTLWTDEKLWEIVSENHEDLKDNWNQLKGIHKSDLGRYLVLYTHGGFYCDTDFYVSGSFDSLNLKEKIYFSPSTPDFIFMNPGVTNYFIYTPRGESFFLDLIEEGLKRIKKYNNTDASYISSTSGKIMIDSVIKQKKYQISSFSDRQIVNKYCPQTDVSKSFAYHDGGTSRTKKQDSWVNGTVLKLISMECSLRNKTFVSGNICQVPIVLIFFTLLLIGVIYFSFRRLRR